MSMRSFRVFVLLTSLLALGFSRTATAANQRPLVHPLFCDHMVLQRDVAAPVWGWAAPGAKVTVEFAGQRKDAIAGEDGRWMVRLGKMQASSEPRVLTIRAGSAKVVQVFDVLVGDVWLCSGQSNMEMGIGTCLATNDIATADFPMIRLVTVPKRVARTPEDTLTCQWSACTPETVSKGGWGGFSATAFFFGRRLHQDLNIPIGLIHSSWGGTIAEAWTSRDQLALLPDFAERLKKQADPTQPVDPKNPNNPNVVTVLYNGMIAPLLPFAIKGAIWYQGESNADRAYQYRSLLPTMIEDWRRRFGVGDFPFYIVQLAAFQPSVAEPREHPWAELREAQALVAKTIPHCGMAVAIDIGEAADIHPKNKQDVGARLALCALAQTYGKKTEYSGPWYKSMTVKGDKISLAFDHAGSGLVAKGGKLAGFAIAGEDRKFVWADAVIDGKKVVVSSPKVPKPAAVRYAWDINPVCNLYNGVGLPAVPFRTDNWPGVTATKK